MEYWWNVPLICRGIKYVLWPLSLVLSIDRAEGPLITAVHRAPKGKYDPHPPTRMSGICALHVHAILSIWNNGGIFLREYSSNIPHIFLLGYVGAIKWNISGTLHSPFPRAICSQCTYPRELFNEFTPHGMMPARLLDDMLLLTKEELSEFSFLDHGPLAIAAVDPEVLKVDMDHAPPDRWHEGVDMCHDMLDAVRAGIEKVPEVATVCVCETMCLGVKEVVSGIFE